MYFDIKAVLLNIVHRVFVVLIAVTVCLRAGVTVFVSTVCMLFSVESALEFCYFLDVVYPKLAGIQANLLR